MTERQDNPSPSPDASPGRSGPAGLGGSFQPTLLGEFEILREIGRGGMGTVYEARQRSLDRLVAVKVLSPHVSASQTAVVRFHREAQSAAKLHHAHIVPIFALGEVGGVYYYAMELIEGPGLNVVISAARDAVDEKTVPAHLAETLPLARGVVSADSKAGSPRSSSSTVHPGRSGTMRSGVDRGDFDSFFRYVATQIADVADALAYAHEEGVVHRDIKPHNLLMHSNGKLMVADFGLARLAAQPGVTMTGEMVGSPLYMSPEQIKGGAMAVDHRTDIYSLGATMYEWLALQPPYPGETREQVISRILTSEAPTLSAHNRRIPADLETICMKAIERDLDRRYRSAADLRDDLRRYLDQRPIRARRASAGTRVAKFVARHPVGSLGAIAAVVAVVLSSALVSKDRQVQTQEAATQEAVDDKDFLLDLAKTLPLETWLTQKTLEAAGPVVEGVVDASQKVATTSVDPSSVGTPVGIARRAARDYYETSMTDGWPGSSQPASGMSLSLWQADPTAAFDRITEYLDGHQDDYDAVSYRAALMGRLGRAEGMLEDARRLVALREDDAAPLIWRAMALLLLGRANESLSDLGRVRKLIGASPWVDVLSGLAFAADRRDVDALLAFDDALDSEPELVVGLLGRAYANAMLGNFNGSVTDLTSVHELQPEDAAVLVVRGDYYVELNEYGAAEQDYLDAMEIAGRDSTITIRYLLARSKRRDLSKDELVPVDSPAKAGIPATTGPPDDRSSGTLPAWISRMLSPGTGKSERPSNAVPGAVRLPSFQLGWPR